MEIKKINLDGTEYEIGGQEYTAGEGITIENGVISASGGSGGGKLYKNTLAFTIGDGSNNKSVHTQFYTKSIIEITAQTIYDYFYSAYEKLNPGDEKIFYNFKGEYMEFEYVSAVGVMNYDQLVLAVHGWAWDLQNEKIVDFHVEVFDATVDNIKRVEHTYEEAL